VDFYKFHAKFKSTGKPILTFFKNADIKTVGVSVRLAKFNGILRRPEHLYSVYENIEGLKLDLNKQLERLTAWRFFETRQVVAVGNTGVIKAISTNNSALKPAFACKPDTDLIKCSVFAPLSVELGHSIMIQVFAHLPSEDKLVESLASKCDQTAELRGVKQLKEVQPGLNLTFCLSLIGAHIDTSTQTLTWRGQAEAVQFGVYIPEQCKTGNIIGTVYVTQDSIPFGHVKFVLTVTAAGNDVPANQAQATGAWKRYEHAFISYASADRVEVLKRVQMLPRFKITFFQDLLTLEPGERWKKELFKYIDKSDVFFLFWSTEAKKSKWVMKEVDYALKQQKYSLFGSPEILPVIIEGPPPVPPPTKLKHLHFNDTFIYFINSD
jgi:hypothetical protein